MSRYLMIDFGSTFTKLVAVDTEKQDIIATASSFTTVATDITIGYENALAELYEKLGEKITFDKIIADNLKVLDLTSVAMCREFDMPVVVYGKNEPDGIIRLLQGEKLGTIIHK